MAQYEGVTEEEQIDKIDRNRAALNNIKVYWDRKNGHIGTGIKSDDVLMCNEFDKMLCEQGIEHTYVVEKNLDHPYPLFPTPEADEAQQLMIDIINETY